jgi:hypothetical protein
MNWKIQVVKFLLYGIWVSRGSEDVSVGLLGCDAMWAEDGGSLFLRIDGIYPQVYIVLQPRRQT